MALFNLKDRVIEAKITYEGPLASGKATTFAALRDRLSGGALRTEGTNGDTVLHVEVTPAKKVNGCDVRVSLVTPRGAHATAAQAAYADTDGIVLVLDATAALDANRDAVSRVRPRTDEGLPVVVQVNKCDVAGAASAADLVAALGIAEWPHLAASASTGEGVVETLESAVDRVVARMKEQSAKGAAMRASPPPPIVPTERRVAEARAAKARSVPPPASNVAVSAPAPTAASDPSAALALLERKVDALAGALASLVPALTAAVGESVAERVAAATAEVTTDVTDRVTDRVTESVKRHLEALESSRAAEAAAAHAADRAAVEGALAGARKVASEAAVEVRRLESALRMIERQQEKATSDVRKLESGLAEVLAVLAPVSSGLSKLVVGLEDVSGTLPRDVARALEAPLVQRTAALERTLLRASEETASRLAGVDEHVTAMASALDKAVDEARQKKKTWFG